MSPLTLTVEAPSHSYPIFIEVSLQAALARELGQYCSKKAAIITNESSKSLALAEGVTATAIFKASSVIVGAPA